MQLKITNNGKQHYSKICLEKSVHYSNNKSQIIEKAIDSGFLYYIPEDIISMKIH